MSTVVDTVVRSILGLVIVAAMLTAIWFAHESEALATSTAALPSQSEAAYREAPRVSPGLYSARVARSQVTRTAIPPQQMEQLRSLSSRRTVTTAPESKGRIKKDLL